MALVGKFVAWENGHAIFGSYKHPRWKPMEVSNSLPINELTVGEAYELQVEGNRLTNFRKAPPRNGACLLSARTPLPRVPRCGTAVCSE